MHENAGTLWEQFRNPGSFFRGKPFWSWNGVLREDELRRQIQVMREMGLGGFFMHSRTGLATEYLGEEWFRLTNACVEEAQKLGMEAWLYDEDRWPSGTAGGMVTKNPRYRMKYLCLHPVPGTEFQWSDSLLAAFACRLDGVVCRECVPLTAQSPASAYQDRTVLCFRMNEMPPSSFYNGYTYADTLNREATECYLQLTHEQYQRHCGEQFGKTIRGIFTDEPHRGAVLCGFGHSGGGEWVTPWTEALPERFRERFGYDLLPHLPELFLQEGGQVVSPVKWHYMELLQSLFLENFAKPIYQWCDAHHLQLTGHVLHEDSLTAQTAMQGSLMRFYEYMHCPGVDVLTEGNRSYWIVKQLQSAARQLGKQQMLSELYGCTGWQMSFESHKAVGDWQALFGINLRCHHLSWYTMAGEAKRDYPASILHQSAWWKDYHYVEDYFARMGLLLSQGKPCCDVLVLNPVESVWCQIYVGWASGLSPIAAPVRELEEAYVALFHWLAGAQIDFDYADEEMLGRLGSVTRDAGGQPVLRVGKAEYRTVVLGKMTTIRGSSVRLLEAFRAAGGKVICAGPAPEYVDALPSPAAGELAARALSIPWDRDALVNACGDSLRCRVTVTDAATGAPLPEIFCQLREDGERRILALLNTNREKPFDAVRIRVPGEGDVSEWKCLTGARYAIPARAADGALEFTASFPPAGEHLYVLEQKRSEKLPPLPVYRETRRAACQGPFAYALSEPNVCVLDFARCRIADGAWGESREILQIDRAVRRHFGLPLRGGEMVQPWFRAKYQPAPKVQGKVTLAFSFSIEQMPQGTVCLCLEKPEDFRLTLNGNPLHAAPQGWWVDTAFRKIALPMEYLRPGENELCLETDFHEGIDLEALYLIGDFGVRLQGTERVLTALPERLAAGDVVSQGLPFYSGAITYKLPAARPAAGERVLLAAPAFEAACLKVQAGELPPSIIAWQPYQAELPTNLPPDAPLTLTAVLTRRNTFGPLHQAPLRAGAYGPDNWVTEGDAFSPEYMLYPSGLLQAPEFVFVTEG